MTHRRLCQFHPLLLRTVIRVHLSSFLASVLAPAICSLELGWSFLYRSNRTLTLSPAFETVLQGLPFKTLPCLLTLHQGLSPGHFFHLSHMFLCQELLPGYF